MNSSALDSLHPGLNDTALAYLNVVADAQLEFKIAMTGL